VQINTTAYLAGKNHPIVRGATPPVPFDNAATAAADIFAGLILEAIAAISVCIIVSLSISAIRKRGKSRPKSELDNDPPHMSPKPLKPAAAAADVQSAGPAGTCRPRPQPEEAEHHGLQDVKQQP
jgi:hypothetical protein